MEKVAISEKVMPGKEKQDAEEVKKVEFNVNAKEFVPLYYQEPPLMGEEPWNVDQQKPVIYKKIDENYNPMFMDGMTEKFIHGPYIGNGKDPEIPFVRSWVTKGQELDFFNKKYFTPDQSGEICFRPYDGSDVGMEEFVAQQKPLFDSNYVNIFRPAFIDFIVHGLLYRQYMAAGRGKGVPPMPRRGGKQPAYQSCRGNGPRSADPNKTLPNGVHHEEIWDNCSAKEPPVAASTPKETSKAKEEEAAADKQEAKKSESPKASTDVELPKEQRPPRYKRKSECTSNAASLKEFIAEYATKNGQTLSDAPSKNSLEDTSKEVTDKQESLVTDCTKLMENLSISDLPNEKDHNHEEDAKLINGEIDDEDL